jgi:hypothetical protein
MRPLTSAEALDRLRASLPAMFKDSAPGNTAVNKRVNAKTAAKQAEYDAMMAERKAR